MLSCSAQVRPHENLLPKFPLDLPSLLPGLPSLPTSQPGPEDLKLALSLYQSELARLPGGERGASSPAREGSEESDDKDSVKDEKENQEERESSQFRPGPTPPFSLLQAKLDQSFHQGGGRHQQVYPSG